MLDIAVAFRLWLGRKVFGFLGPKCIRISLNRIVKGPTLPAEATALLFVAENTNIRVPKVYHTYNRKDGFYIEMEYIRGQTVEEMWATISVEEKDRIIKDLAACVNQLRQLEPKVLGIGSSDMEQTKDLRLSFQPFGPFQNVEDFHAFVRKNLPLENCEEVFGEEVFLCHSSKYSIRMSHSDISLRLVPGFSCVCLSVATFEVGLWHVVDVLFLRLQMRPELPMFTSVIIRSRAISCCICRFH